MGSSGVLLTCEQPGGARRRAQPLLTHGLGHTSSVAWGSSHLHQQLRSTNHQGDDLNSESSPADGNDFSNHPDHKLAASVSTMLSSTEP